MCCKGIAYCSTTHAWEISVEPCTAKDQCYLPSSGNCACTGASDRPRLELAVPCRRMTSTCCTTWPSTWPTREMPTMAGTTPSPTCSGGPGTATLPIQEALSPLPTGTRSGPQPCLCVVHNQRYMKGIVQNTKYRFLRLMPEYLPPALCLWTGRHKNLVWQPNSHCALYMQIIWPKINYLVSSIQLSPWYLRGGSIESSSGLSSAQTFGNASLDAATTLGALSSGGLISTGASINSTVGRSTPSCCTPPHAALTITGTISA